MGGGWPHIGIVNAIVMVEKNLESMKNSAAQVRQDPSPLPGRIGPLDAQIAELEGRMERNQAELARNNASIASKLAELLKRLDTKDQ